MGTIWKTVITFGVIIMITVLGMSITAVNAELTNASDYMAEVSAVIRACNYNQEIIQQCKTEAEQNGYVLEVEVYENSELPGKRYAKVSLNYKYHFPFMQTDLWKKKVRII